MIAPLDLASIARWVSRPGANPAPTHTNPSDADRPTADIVADLYAAIARSRRARGATTDDLPEVA